MPKKRITRAVQKVPGMAPKGSLSEKMTMAFDRRLNSLVNAGKGLVARRGENMKMQGQSLKAVESMNRKLGDKPKVARARATKTVKAALKSR